MQKVRPDDLANAMPTVAQAPQSAQLSSMGIPQFLKRMSMGVMSK
jgi:hypothetical protein